MQNLGKHLKHPLKKRIEQKFIYTRLSLFDEAYHLDLKQSLFQTYFDLGSQQQQQELQVWPVSE